MKDRLISQLIIKLIYNILCVLFVTCSPLAALCPVWGSHIRQTSLGDGELLRRFLFIFRT